MTRNEAPGGFQEERTPGAVPSSRRTGFRAPLTEPDVHLALCIEMGWAKAPLAGLADALLSCFVVVAVRAPVRSKDEHTDVDRYGHGIHG